MDYCQSGSVPSFERQPILEDVVGYDRAQVRAFFEANGLVIREGDRARTDRLSIEAPEQPPAR